MVLFIRTPRESPLRSEQGAHPGALAPLLLQMLRVLILIMDDLARVRMQVLVRQERWFWEWVWAWAPIRSSFSTLMRKLTSRGPSLPVSRGPQSMLV